jgi:virginiamycin B lyase
LPLLGHAIDATSKGGLGRNEHVTEDGVDMRQATLFCAMAAAGMLAVSGGTASGSADVEITEWQVPWPNTRPRDPWVSGPDRVWFVGQRADYVATFDPQTGDFRRYDLDDGTGPHTVVADGRGAWYAGNRARHVGLIDPETGEIEKIVLPGEGRGDVHTMDLTSDGHIWFTVQHGNQIGFLDTASREIALHDVATAGARPYGLVVDGDDRPWAVLFGTNKLATVVDGRVEEVTLPREDARPRRLVATGDGMIWYVDYAQGYLGRYDPARRAVAEWRTPGGEQSRPYAIAADDHGRLWLVETGPRPNRFVGFDPETETFTEPVEIESGGGTVRHMVFDAESRAVWFGTDTDTIARARIH